MTIIDGKAKFSKDFPAPREKFYGYDMLKFLASIDPEDWPCVADAQKAQVGIERLAESVGREPQISSFFEALASEETGRRFLEILFGNSPFLSQCLLREPAFTMDLLASGPDETFTQLIVNVDKLGREGYSFAQTASELRRCKRMAALLTAVADIFGIWPVERVTGALSEFAQAAVQAAVRTVMKDSHNAGEIVLPNLVDPENECGYVVLGMGKLGAYELNYSSDIDLIVLYDPDRVNCPDPDRMQKNFVRLTRALLRLLDERTADGYVFRTDLRLRPDPAATPLAISVQAAEEYYESMGQNWERAAMIKARPVAGDVALGWDFLNHLIPYVWRRNLDFAALEDIRSIKRQITAHRGGAKIAVNGHNIKLGRGGIREIEFFAQTQQLIWGGRNPELRSSQTCATLHDFARHGIITQETADQLTESYRFLRTVEHRIQMTDDAQTHDIPDTDDGVNGLSAFLGYDSRDDFSTDLLHHLHCVEEIFGALFDDSDDLGGGGALVFTGADDHPDTVKHLNEMGFDDGRTVSAIIRAWHHGRYRATRSERARQLLTELTPGLLTAIAGTADPNAAFIRFDAFLKQLPAGVQLFSLFAENPTLLNLVAEIMGDAPRMAEWLRRNPNSLEAVLMPGTRGEAKITDWETFLAELLHLTARDKIIEDTLNTVRRWTNDHKFQIGVQMLRGSMDGRAAGPILSNIADAALIALWRKVQAEFERQHGRVDGGEMAIVSFGKLGGREMAFRSDLDMVFVYDHDADASASDGSKPLAPTLYFTRLSQRLITAVSAQTAEGTLYEIDMRLRPSGNKGPIASRFESFDSYHADNAWTWENMALTRARIVDSPVGLAQKIETVIWRTLTIERDAAALHKDVASMRARIAKEHTGRSAWDVKYRPGGLVDIEFVVQCLMLRHASAVPGVLATNTQDGIQRLMKNGFLSQADADLLDGALRLWQRLQGILRLTANDMFDDSAATAGQLNQVLRAGEAENITLLKARMDKVGDDVRNAFIRLVGPLE